MQNLLFENGLAVIPELKERLLVPMLSRANAIRPYIRQRKIEFFVAATLKMACGRLPERLV